MRRSAAAPATSSAAFAGKAAPGRGRRRLLASLGPQAAPVDPSLRLELRLDDETLASYVDSTLDPEDLPKAVVNSFVFSPDHLMSRVAPASWQARRWWCRARSGCR